MLIPMQRLVCIFLISLGLMACGATYEITDPPDGSFHEVAPSVTITYQEQPETFPTVTLNGSDVTALFSISDSEAIALSADLDAYIKEGINDIRIDAQPVVQSRFIIDTQGPEVVVESATRGSTTIITGRTIDAAGVATLSINGVDISVNEDGSFVAEVSTNDIYQFDAVDVLNHASSVAYRDYQLLYDDAVIARVNQTGLDFITEELIDLVNDLDLTALIGGTEIYKRGILRGEITTLDMTAQSFTLDPTNTKLNLEGLFTGARAKLRLVNIVVLKPTLRVDRVVVTGDVVLSESNGNPNITIGDLSVDLQGISFDGALGVFDSILGGLISGIVNRFEDRIGNEIKSAVNDVLAEQLTQLIPENTRIVINDRELALDLELASIYTNNDSLFIGLSGGVLPLTPNSLIPDPLGPVYTSDSLPAPVLGGDLGIAVNSNVINQTLVAAYASGITHLMLLGDQVLFDIPRNDELGDVGQSRILVNPGAAPYISLKETNGESSTTLTIRNLEVISENKSDQGWSNEFKVDLDASIEINVAVNEDSSLKINFVSEPVIDVKRTIIGAGLTIPSDLIDDILRNEIPGILDQISQSLSGIKLPSIGGYVLTADDFYALGENASHAGLTGSLSKAP